MSVIRKIVTATKLLARLEFAVAARQLKRMIARREFRRNGGRPFAHNRLGFPCVCHPDWPDSASQFLDLAGDHWEFDLIRCWGEPGDTVIDVGANLGLYTFAAAAHVGAGGTVIAVEAAPFVVGKLAESARILGTNQVVILQTAVMERSGTVSFYVRLDQNVTTEQSLHPSSVQRDVSTAIEVPAVTLAELQRKFASAQPVSVVKLDIEGAEAAALAAAPAEWLGTDGPLWIVEINPEALARFDATAAEIIALFPVKHFERWLLPKHPTVPGTKVALRPIHDERSTGWDDSLYYNFFALPRGSRWQERRARARRLIP